MSEQVLCKDCKHSFRRVVDWLSHGSASFAYSCRNSYKPAHLEPDLVLGVKKVPATYDSCGVARIGHPSREDRCGAEGKFWEPKNKRDLFKFIKHVGA
jgi:hypothetical protein